MQPEMVARPCLVVRVSTDDQDTQQQQFEALEWIQQRYGVVLTSADIFAEEGVSGRLELDERPGLKTAFMACLAGRYTHLIVRKIDRSARNVAVMADIIRKLDKAGVAFIAIMEGVDTSVYGDKFKAHLFLSFAEQFSDNLAQEVLKGKRKRNRMGLSNGVIPYGAQHGPDGVPIPDTRPIIIVDSLGLPHDTTRYAGICFLFQLAADGVNSSDIAREMNRRGYRTLSPQWKEREWGRSTVRHVLDNRFYIGEVAVGSYGPQRTWIAGAHAPLIDIAQWDAAQTALDRHAMRPDRAKRTARDLVFGRGILRCMTCRERGRDIGFHAARNHQGTTYYICGTRNRGQDCAERLVSETVIEHAFLAWLGDPAVDEEELAEAAQRYLATLPESQRPVDTQERKAALKKRLARLAELYELGEYERGVYLERRRKVQEEMAALDHQDTAQVPFTVEELQRTLEYIRDFPTMWAVASRRERTQLVRTLVRAIWLQGGRIVDVEATLAYEGYFALRRTVMEVS